MAWASGQDVHEPTAEQARVVHAKSKYVNKAGVSPPLPSVNRISNSPRWVFCLLLLGGV